MLQDLTQFTNQVPKLREARFNWDSEGDWANTGTIHFVDAAYQPYFTSFTDFDCHSTLYAWLRPEGDSIAYFEASVPIPNIEQMTGLPTGTSCIYQPEIDDKPPSSRKRKKPTPTPLFNALQIEEI